MFENSTVSAVRDELVWIDCEMTGLDLSTDRLIEIAVLVTDADLNILGEAGSVVHMRDDLDHSGQRIVGSVDDDVDAFAQDIEVGISDQDRDFNESIGLEVQAGHLTVDPHQFFAHSNQQ